MAFKFKKLFEDNDDEMQSVSEDEFYSISKEDAVKEASESFDNFDLTLFAGSLYLIGEIRGMLK